MRGTQKYTDDELKRYLNEWVQEHDEEPTKEAWNADGTTPSARTYYSRFGGWEQAKQDLID